MVEHYDSGGFNAWPPTEAPFLSSMQRDEQWRHFDNSVNAVSFGFVATAILISMFLVMAVFERFLKPSSSGSRGDLESQMGFNSKIDRPSPKMSLYPKGVSVLMPGDNIPTFIAHPAPIPCPREGISCSHQHHINLVPNPATMTNADLSWSSTQQH